MITMRVVVRRMLSIIEIMIDILIIDMHSVKGNSIKGTTNSGQHLEFN